jgi:hypothetical protein
VGVFSAANEKLLLLLSSSSASAVRNSYSGVSGFWALAGLVYGDGRVTEVMLLAGLICCIPHEEKKKRQRTAARDISGVVHPNGESSAWVEPTLAFCLTGVAF